MSQYREPALSINEQSFVRTSLAAGLRVDGRGLQDMRDVTVSFPGASGTAQVQLGGTRVLAVTTADLVVPFPDRPNEGALNIFVNFSPMASPAYEPGHPSERGVEMSRLVERALRESRAIDLESLCVLAGEKVWAVRLDAHVLDAAGNVLDTLSLAAVSALAHFRRPDVTVVGENVTVHSVEDRQPVALALHHLPISVSFAFFDPAASSGGAASAASSSSQPLMLVDPSLKEELVADSGLTVTLNVHGEICCLQKSGGLGVGLEPLLAATRVAQTKVADLTSLIHAKLKEDAAQYNTGNAVRPGAAPSAAARQPLYHVPQGARPIDAVGGGNVTRPAGQHVTAGVPIEVTVGEARRKKHNAAQAEEEDSEDESDDEDESEEEDGEGDSNMQDAEQAQASAKLQAKLAQQAPAAKSKK